MTTLHDKSKIFVVDTNVLIHDPFAVRRFGNNNLVVVTGESLEELDRLKGEHSDRGQAARMAVRVLSDIFEVDTNTRGSTASLPEGGRVHLAVRSGLGSERTKDFVRTFSGVHSPDNGILACATGLASQPGARPVVVVTKDINMRLKARAIGMEAEDYKYDSVNPDSVAVRADACTIAVNPHEMQAFASSGVLLVDHKRSKNLTYNDYVVLDCKDTGKSMPARHCSDGRLVHLLGGDGVRVPDGCHVRPLNMGQRFLFDALLNPDISLVTVTGQAGTGKTLVAVAAGLHLLGSNVYDGLTITRPVVALGDGIGFLPGSMEEKMTPWLQPYFDACNFLLSSHHKLQQDDNGRPKKHSARKQKRDNMHFFHDSNARCNGNGHGTLRPYERLLASGQLEIQALCYIRGRSIPGRLFLLDEAQLITPHQAKTVVTRIARGSKIILMGDPAQIDTPYVDSKSNGLVYTRERMRGLPMVAAVNLTKGERSPLSEEAALRM